jgi:hypothetical protein
LLVTLFLGFDSDFFLGVVFSTFSVGVFSVGGVVSVGFLLSISVTFLSFMLSGNAGFSDNHISFCFLLAPAILSTFSFVFSLDHAVTLFLAFPLPHTATFSHADLTLGFLSTCFAVNTAAV